MINELNFKEQLDKQEAIILANMDYTINDEYNDEEYIYLESPIERINSTNY